MTLTFKKLSIAAILSFSLLTVTYKNLTYNQAIDNAENKILELLMNYKAFRTYVSKVQKEEIYRLQQEGIIYEEYFRPQILSSTFSAKNVNNFYNEFRASKKELPIKIRFSSPNPRNPANQATLNEKELIEKFNSNTITKHLEIIDSEKGKLLYYAIPTKRITKECMRCHSDPKLAPKELLKIYGDKNGFFEQEGKIRALLSTTYPLTKDLSDANRLFVLLTSITFVIFSVMLFLAYKLLRTVEYSNLELDKQVCIKTDELNNKTTYLQKILDNSPNLVLLSNGYKLIDGNRAFLELFNYPSVEEFLKEHDCICDFFEEIDDQFFIISKKIKDKLWVNYIEENRDINHKVKIIIDGEDRYFSIKVEKFDLSDTTKNNFLVILSDITQLEKQKREYREIASTDQLTEAASRFQFDILLDQEMKNAHRHETSLSIIFFDYDNFKNVNDTYGHDVGDYVLKEVSSVVRETLRDSDIFARWGGEEFAVLLPTTSALQAKEIAEKIRVAVSGHTYETVTTQTCSFGVTELESTDCKESFLKRADEALYKAKYSGKNRVEVTV